MPPLQTKLTSAQSQAIKDALRKYSGEVSQSKLDQILGGIRQTLESVLNPQQSARGATEGLNPATARNAIADILQWHGVEVIGDQIDFTVKIATEVAHNAGNFVRSNAADVVEAYPAWELLRVYDRDVPRGFRRGPKGTLIEVPDEAWPARWEAACAAAGDEDALRVFQATGRMIALKDSDVWQQLGDGAGGYNDTLGNPYPPFAFNSGFDVNEVSDQECLQLGLLEPNEKPKPARFDVAKLFSPVV